MVKINQKQGNYNKGSFLPTMWQHKLLVLEDSGPFKEGDTVICYVASYDDNRFAVWSTHFGNHNIYKVFSQEDLHRVFDEVA